jgi:hypothetical protein
LTVGQTKPGRHHASSLFVGHIPTNPTSVDRGPSRTTASGRAAATLFPSMMQ